jgi:hypothetical protein
MFGFKRRPPWPEPHAPQPRRKPVDDLDAETKAAIELDRLLATPERWSGPQQPTGVFSKPANPDSFPGA